MTSRERFLKALNFQEPDYVPVFANLTPQLAEKLGKEMNLPYEPEDSFLSTRNSHTEILLELGNDGVGIAACREIPTKTLENGTIKDEWGIIYKQVGFYTEAIIRPLAHVETIEQLDQYRIPDPLAPSRWELAEKMVKKYSKDYAIIGDLEATMYELAWNLVGMEKFIMDMAMGKDYVFELLDRLMDFNLTCAKRMINLGADMIWTGDDVGTQKGMMMSPAMWRQVLKPRMKKMFDEMKKENPSIKIAYHSCGSIVPIIEDLIEIGLDVLNPIQPLAKGMDLALFKKKYGDKLVFFGGVDVQDVLPHGTTEDVEAEVRRRIQAAAKGGGFIIAPAHNIQPDTSIENIKAFFRAVKKYGKYPIQ
jgi:uroporphyrinogen decarboxylase